MLCGRPQVVQSAIKRSTATPLGTPGYQCPRYVKTGRFDAAGRADVFSFGVLLAELLTGRLQMASAKHSEEAGRPPPRSWPEIADIDMEVDLVDDVAQARCGPPPARPRAPPLLSQRTGRSHGRPWSRRPGVM
jgi:hypothetical protein